MSNPPLVSIVIPCFNAEATVAEAIASAQAQTHRPIEILVVDDGSTDGSVQAIRRLPQHELRLTCTRNRGGNAARNLALSQARGAFIQFLDADDLLRPEKLAKQLAVYEDSCDVVLSDFVLRQRGAKEAEQVVRLPPVGGDVAAYIIRNSVWTSSPLHRRSSLVGVGGWDERLRCCQEYDLHFRLAIAAWRDVRHVPEALAVRRRLPGSVSSNEQRIYEVMLDLLQRWYQDLHDKASLTVERRAAISDVAYACGRKLVVLERAPKARLAFSLSRLASSRGRLPLVGAMGVLTRCVGPILAERLRAMLRRRA